MRIEQKRIQKRGSKFNKQDETCRRGEQNK